MADAEHASELLRHGRKDLSALCAMSDSEAFADEISGFHAQQAAEKALKA
jgi:HEPN domain-containing protein